MNLLTLAPRTPEWYSLRNESWTASMAAVLVAKDNAIALRDYALAKGVTLDIEPLLAVGLDSFFEHTLWSVWADKTGRIPRFRGNADTARGQSNEEAVVAAFEESKGFTCTRDVTATKDGDDWFLASFDALAPASSDTSVVAPNGFPVEAKCPAFPSRKKLWNARKTLGSAVKGLAYYWCQVQHQILVADAPYGWFAAVGMELDKTTGELVETFPMYEKVMRDDAFLTAYKAAADFYYHEFIYKMEEPPLLDTDKALLVELAAQATVDAAFISKDYAKVSDILESWKTEATRAANRVKVLEGKIAATARELQISDNEVITLDDSLSVKFSMTASTGWQKLAGIYLKRLGVAEHDPEDLKAVAAKPRESVKITGA